MPNKKETRLIAIMKYPTDLSNDTMEASDFAEMADIMMEQNPKGTMVKPAFITLTGDCNTTVLIADVPVEIQAEACKKIKETISSYRDLLDGKTICVYSDRRYIPMGVPSSLYKDKLNDDEAFFIDGTEYLYCVLPKQFR